MTQSETAGVIMVVQAGNAPGLSGLTPTGLAPGPAAGRRQLRPPRPPGPRAGGTSIMIMMSVTVTARVYCLRCTRIIFRVGRGVIKQ